MGVEGSKPSWTLTFSFSRKKQKTMEEDIEVEGEWRKVKVYGKYTPQRPGKQPSYDQFVLEAKAFADLPEGGVDKATILTKTITESGTVEQKKREVVYQKDNCNERKEGSNPWQGPPPAFKLCVIQNGANKWITDKRGEEERMRWEIEESNKIINEKEEPHSILKGQSWKKACETKSTINFSPVEEISCGSSKTQETIPVFMPRCGLAPPSWVTHNWLTEKEIIRRLRSPGEMKGAKEEFIYDCQQWIRWYAEQTEVLQSWVKLLQKEK